MRFKCVCVCVCAGCVCGVCLVYGYSPLDTLHSAASTVEHDLKTILLHLSLFYLLLAYRISCPPHFIFKSKSELKLSCIFSWYFQYICLTSFSSLLEFQNFIKIFHLYILWIIIQGFFFLFSLFRFVHYLFPILRFYFVYRNRTCEFSEHSLILHSFWFPYELIRRANEIYNLCCNSCEFSL